MRHRLTKVACGAAALALVLGVTAETRAGKPDKPTGTPANDQPKTQACTLGEEGDATGEGQVGIDAKSYGKLTLTLVEGKPLESVFSGALSDLMTFHGQGRVLKRQGYLDFHFDSGDTSQDLVGCRPIEFGEEPGPGLDPDVCQYHLQMLNGVYDRKADTVTFTNTMAQIFDYRSSMPNEDGSGYKLLIGSGSASVLVQFE
jgi:hypothetical protein